MWHLKSLRKYFNSYQVLLSARHLHSHHRTFSFVSIFSHRTIAFNAFRKDHEAILKKWRVVDSTYLGQYDDSEDGEERNHDEKGHAGALSRAPCAFLTSLL